MKQRHSILSFVFYSLCVLSCIPSTSEVEHDGGVAEISDFDILREKIVAHYMQNPSNLQVESLITKQLSDGSYEDLDYDSSAKVYWEPLDHLSRLVSLSCAYINPQNEWYQSDILFDHIKSGLNYYYVTNPQKSSKQENWYAKTISEPLLFGKIFLNMKSGKKQLPEGFVHDYLSRWESQGGVPSDQTSANTTDVAMHRLFLSILKEDSDMLDDALYYLFESVQYSDDIEGFQYDNSYTFHGRQFYIGGYGEVVLTNVLTVACWVKGTRFEMDPAKVELLREFILNTFAGVIRGRVMNFNALGRSVSREDYLYKTDIRADFMRQMAIIDNDYRAYYDAIRSRICGVEAPDYMITPKNTCFYIADYMSHQRPEWAVGIRSCSNRTVRQEVYANNENLLGYFCSDGSTAITVTGEEYGNIMPLWDWNHIPGVTAPVLSQIPTPEIANGSSVFSGGVSDSLYGIAVYDYWDQYSPVMTGARKSWFLFDKEMVCLGTNIRGEHHTHTTVDQNWGNGMVDICTNDLKWQSKSTIDGSLADDVLFVVHNNIGYYFPSGGHVFVEKRERQGSWRDINVNQSDRMIQGQVFEIYLDHNVPDEKKDQYSERYEYVVCPRKNKEEMVDYLHKRKLSIYNMENIQAVVDDDNDLAEIVFFSPAVFNFEDLLQIKTTKACAVMVQNFKGSASRLIVSDILRDHVPFSISLTKPHYKESKIDITFASTNYYGESMTFLLGWD